MTPEAWQQIRALFDAGLELPPAERAGWLAETACDEAVRDEVRRLLAAHESAEAFLAAPAIARLAGLIEHAPRRPEPDLTGQRLGDYQVVRELGRGAMGAVYLAARADGAFQKQVAIKLLLPAGAEAFAARRFQQERQILADLDHPRIARLLDAGATAAGCPYFVMEYVEGESLRQRLQRLGALPLAEVLEIARQACAGLAAAHRLGVVHRDLKPANLMVGERDGALTVKLLDFGIARVASAPAGAPASTDAGTDAGTEAGVILGTAAYLSPEQAAGMTGPEIDARADVYAMGMVIYEMLTGRTAFHGASWAAALQHHQHSPPPSPRRARPDLRIPDAIERVVLKALAKDRNARQQAISDLSAELETAFHQTREPQAPARKRSRRRDAQLIAGAVAAMLISVALWAARQSHWWARPPARPASPATLAAAPAAQPTSVLWYRVRKEQRGEAATLDAENTVRKRDRLRFEFKLARRGALYLFCQQRDGALIWGNPAPNGVAPDSPADEWLRIPERAPLELDNRAGTQRYWLLYVPQGRPYALWQRAPAIRPGVVPHAVIPRADAARLRDRLLSEAVMLTAVVWQRDNLLLHELSQTTSEPRPALHIIELRQVR